MSQSAVITFKSWNLHRYKTLFEKGPGIERVNYLQNNTQIFKKNNYCIKLDVAGNEKEKESQNMIHKIWSINMLL